MKNVDVQGASAKNSDPAYVNYSVGHQHNFGLTVPRNSAV